MMFAKPLAGLLAASLLASFPAQAGSSNAGASIQLVGGHYYDDDDDDIDCAWPRDRYERRQCERWRERQGRHERRKRDKDRDVEAAIGLGILGLAVGAIIAGSAAEQNAKERRREKWNTPCHQRYGYDRRSNTFIGDGGRRFFCS
ncbi:hypothetical protein [Aminobacter sp. AP02]|uniref:hypothetical protein n=1 Tax=Aminobacter sp. AP02 TaxID=2135737 RepID=UPI000D6C1EA6|nr:hypothetical protein [Aminobacter sp. AP02]PWK75652.1 hypothetical protein C8K44_103220 [Aminobacter sp. AP02]